MIKARAPPCGGKSDNQSLKIYSISKCAKCGGGDVTIFKKRTLIIKNVF